MAGDRAKLVAEVNRLYWETDQPVTELAERLGISRRTVYDMIVPRPVEEPCPECGGPLTYASRSARLSGEALCGLCGRTQDITLLRELSNASRAPLPAEEERAVALTTRPHTAPVPVRPAHVRPVPRRPSPTLTTLLVGTLLLTVLAALLIPAPTRRRRRW
jgi:hypothetical protein